jgi:hypothetical protein
MCCSCGVYDDFWWMKEIKSVHKVSNLNQEKNKSENWPEIAVPV